MTYDADESLSRRILILFVITTSVLIFQGIYNIFSLEDVNTSITQVHESAFQINETGSEISQPASELRQLTMNLVMAPNQEVKDQIKQQIAVKLEKINGTLAGDSLTKYADSNSYSLLQEIKTHWQNYQDSVNETIEFSGQGVRIAEFLHVTTSAKDAYDKLTLSIQDFNNYQLGLTEQIYAEAQSTSTIAFWSVLITTVVEAVILKVILAYVLNLVKKYIDNKKQHAQELEEKNQALQKSLENLKTLQTQLIESEKMASMTQLVSGIAHEINTPLGIGITASSMISGQIKTINKSIEEQSLRQSQLMSFLSSSEQSHQVLQSNLNKAAELVQRFKELSADNLVGKATRFNLVAKIEDTLTALGPKLKEVSLEVEGDRDIELETDPSAIYHSISNLVMNSLNHGFKESGHHQITIKIKTVSDNQINIEYSDNGCGIEEDKIKNIFEPFYTTKRGQGGTGLGLSIVFNVLSQINGQINCQSKVGEGTTFTISIHCPVLITEPA